MRARLAVGLALWMLLALAGAVTAIATRNQKKLAGDWTSIQGNFGPRGGHVDLSKVKGYADYADMLADPEIAEMVGLAESTVRWRLARAMTRLASELE